MHNGVVTLSGSVDSYNKKIAAERATQRVKGDRSVAVDIESRLHKNGVRTDTDIADAIVSALKWNSAVPDEKLTSKVDNGYVLLEGEVEWQFQKDAAENAIKYLTGVRGISNLI